MSFNRAPFQAIVDGLCLRADITPEVAEQFVTTFFDIIRENLRLDKIVKVRGLGTFKMVDVEARESIKVGTGERYVIDGHSKVTFTPDPVLRDAVNRPFADFDTVFLNDGLDLAKMEDLSAVEPSSAEISVIDAQIDDDVPMASVADVVDVQQPEPEVEQPVAEEPEVEEPQIATEPVIEVEPIQEDEEPQSEETTTVAETPADADEQPKTEEQPVSALVSEDNSHSHRHHCRHRCCIIWNVLGAIVMLFVGYLLGYYVQPIQLPGKQKNVKIVEVGPAEPIDSADLIELVETKDTINNDVSTDKAEESAETAKPAQEPAKPAQEDAETQNYPQLEGGDYEIVGVEGTEVMRPGKTLLNLSIKYYGSKDFVKYICLMNGIKNPDIVPLDKELQIPTLRKKE